MCMCMYMYIYMYVYRYIYMYVYVYTCALPSAPQNLLLDCRSGQVSRPCDETEASHHTPRMHRHVTIAVAIPTQHNHHHATQHHHQHGQHAPPPHTGLLLRSTSAPWQGTFWCKAAATCHKQLPRQTGLHLKNQSKSLCVYTHNKQVRCAAPVVGCLPLKREGRCRCISRSSSSFQAPITCESAC